MRSVTIFGRNRPKIGDNFENQIQYLNSLLESSWKEEFLRNLNQKCLVQGAFYIKLFKFKFKLFKLFKFKKNYFTQVRRLT